MSNDKYYSAQTWRLSHFLPLAVAKPMNIDDKPEMDEMDIDHLFSPPDLMSVDEWSQAAVDQVNSISHLVSPEPPQKCPDLPLEIQYHIIDIYRVGTPRSLHLSLVAKDWLWFVRGDRFRVIRMGLSRVVTFWHLAMSPLCTIRQAVEVLQLALYPYRPNGDKPDFAALARLLPSLRCLHLDAYDLDFDRTLFKQAFPCVETLVMRRMQNALPGDSYPGFVSEFPSLRRLVIEEIPPNIFLQNNYGAISRERHLPSSLIDLAVTHPRINIMEYLASYPSGKNITTLSFHIVRLENFLHAAVQILKNVGAGLTQLTLQLDNENADLPENIWNFSANINLSTLIIKGQLSYARDRQAWMMQVLERVDSPLRKLVFSIKQLTEHSIQRWWPHAALQALFKRRIDVFQGLEEVMYIARGGMGLGET
ncbi:hypothetical protein D9756_010071 [Leucocoprinus leucothites]|uniref:Uncharacterized protein n=1 Tax=Leucocoprinus leucothites TaxID=201217 RepID=A0A8H5FR19_9AGAR|nr:hypothetical protein D9756_010071 [Leucoagaricus leucothites]